jgi:hypothetical protein
MSAASLASQASPTRHLGLRETGDNYRSQARSSLNGRPSAQLERDGRRSAPHTPTESAPSSQHASRKALSSPTSPSLSPAHPEPVPPRYSTNPSSPAIVVPEDAPEAGPRVSMPYLQPEPPNDSGAQSFLSPDVPISIERRKSYDDGTRPLDILFQNNAPRNSSQSLRLTDRASKRNSINPGTTFNYDAVTAEFSKPMSPPDPPLSNVLPTSDADRAMIQTDTRPLASKEQAAGELSSQPSRKAPADTPAFASSVTSSKLGWTESAPKPTASADSVRPPLRQNMMLERIPPRTHSLNTSGQDSQVISRRLPMASVTNGTSGRATSNEKDKPKHGSSLSIDVEKSRAGYGKSPMSPAHNATSPAHKVDVPRGIESGTDTSDGEREPGADKQNTQPIPTKRNETKTKPRPRPMQLDIDMKPSDESGDTSFLNSAGDADSEEESSPVERVSRSTFIAPAHPPIRVSISANGFQELLSLVNPRNRSSLQSIEELVKLNQDAAARLDSGRSSTSLNPDGNVAQSEGQRSTSPATTPTTLGSSSVADNASVTTISAPSSHGHGESLDQREMPNGVVSDSPSHHVAIHDAVPTLSNGRPLSDVPTELLVSGDQRVRLDSTVSRHAHADGLKHGAHITITAPDVSVLRSAKPDPSYTVTKRLRDALQEAVRRSTTQIMLDQEFVQAIIMTIEQRRDENAQMKGKLDHIKVRCISLLVTSKFTTVIPFGRGPASTLWMG